MIDGVNQLADRSTESPRTPKSAASTSELAAPTVAPPMAAIARVLAGDGQDGAAVARLHPPQRHQALLSLQRMSGNAALQRLLRAEITGVRGPQGTTLMSRMPSASPETATLAGTDARVQR